MQEIMVGGLRHEGTGNEQIGVINLGNWIRMIMMNDLDLNCAGWEDVYGGIHITNYSFL